MRSVDLSGKQFGLLTVLHRVDDHIYSNGRHDIKYLCQCKCGSKVDILAVHLRSGRTVSCGCVRREKLRENRTTHGMTNTRLYSIWKNMKERCNNKDHKNYNQYGGRGISVCDEWRADFSKFAEWASANGYDDILTLDRVNTNGNYCPENCAWHTQKQQCNNTNRNINITYGDCTHTMKEWSELLNISYSMLSSRILRGWDPQKALETPPRKITHI